MAKYERILKNDEGKKATVLKILKILNGKNSDEIKEILDAAKYFVTTCATFDVAAVEDIFDEE